MKNYIQYFACFLLLMTWALTIGRAEAGKIPLSEADLDAVSAQGIGSSVDLPISIAVPTNTIAFTPASTGTLTNVNTIVNTNTQLVLCVLAVCVNSGATAVNTNSIVSDPSITSPQTNNFLNSVQAPAFSNTSGGSGMTWQVPTIQNPVAQIPSFQVPTVQAPTVQVPTVQVPTVSTTGFRFSFP